MKGFRFFLERYGFAVSSRLAEKLGVRAKDVRIFFIYDGDTLVILFNGFRKKTQKTPRQEIEKAKRLKDEYYASKRD